MQIRFRSVSNVCNFPITVTLRVARINTLNHPPTHHPRPTALSCFSASLLTAAKNYEVFINPGYLHVVVVVVISSSKKNHCNIAMFC